jgi:serine/threonine-protein kinase
MAPEQARDRAEVIDGRTDLWAVGATMFTLLTGNSVHKGETESDRILEAATRPVRSLGHDMPNLNAALIDLVDCALSFDPKQRFADASAMRAAIDLLIDDLQQRRTQ